MHTDKSDHLNKSPKVIKTKTYSSQKQEIIKTVIRLQDDQIRLIDTLKNNYKRLDGIVGDSKPTCSYLVFYILLISIKFNRCVIRLANAMLEAERRVTAFLNSIFRRLIQLKVAMAVVLLVPFVIMCSLTLIVISLIWTINCVFRVALLPVKKSSMKKYWNYAISPRYEKSVF